MSSGPTAGAPDTTKDTAQSLPDRSMNPAAEGSDPQAGEQSKSAAKKAAKREKQAAEKASKGNEKGIGKTESKQSSAKAPKKKIDNALLIGIDVSKEDDFAGWYQQVLLKGDMLDYYDVSGCFVLKVYIKYNSTSKISY